MTLVRALARLPGGARYGKTVDLPEQTVRPFITAGLAVEVDPVVVVPPAADPPAEEDAELDNVIDPPETIPTAGFGRLAKLRPGG